jgi:hypothetical protein
LTRHESRDAQAGVPAVSRRVSLIIDLNGVIPSCARAFNRHSPDDVGLEQNLRYFPAHSKRELLLSNGNLGRPGNWGGWWMAGPLAARGRNQMNSRLATASLVRPPMAISAVGVHAA